ncbi:hypothetical protein NMY22_g6561 [Coprinellus aureogranulatus]|nr:hypothetical protein NMY22_g6561 [Coprinellus aureogranulatus]
MVELKSKKILVRDELVDSEGEYSSREPAYAVVKRIPRPLRPTEIWKDRPRPSNAHEDQAMRLMSHVTRQRLEMSTHPEAAYSTHSPPPRSLPRAAATMSLVSLYMTSRPLYATPTGSSSLVLCLSSSKMNLGSWPCTLLYEPMRSLIHWLLSLSSAVTLNGGRVVRRGDHIPSWRVLKRTLLGLTLSRATTLTGPIVAYHLVHLLRNSTFFPRGDLYGEDLDWPRLRFGIHLKANKLETVLRGLVEERHHQFWEAESIENPKQAWLDCLDRLHFAHKLSTGVLKDWDMAHMLDGADDALTNLKGRVDKP